MKKPIHLTIDEEIHRKLKRKRINISKYVDKLILKDMALSNSRNLTQRSEESGSNPDGSTIINLPLRKWTFFEMF